MIQCGSAEKDGFDDGDAPTAKANGRWGRPRPRRRSHDLLRQTPRSGPGSKVLCSVMMQGQPMHNHNQLGGIAGTLCRYAPTKPSQTSGFRLVNSSRTTCRFAWKQWQQSPASSQNQRTRPRISMPTPEKMWRIVKTMRAVLAHVPAFGRMRIIVAGWKVGLGCQTSQRMRLVE